MRLRKVSSNELNNDTIMHTKYIYTLEIINDTEYLNTIRVDGTLQGFLGLDWLTYFSITSFSNLFMNTNPIRVLNMVVLFFPAFLKSVIMF